MADAKPSNGQLNTGTLLMVLGTIITWSSSFPAISYGLEHFTPGELSLGRFLIASICFIILMLFGVIKVPERRFILPISILGAIGIAAYQLFLGYGMTRVSAGAASVLIALSPSVTAALAAWKLREGIDRRLQISLLLAFVGAVIVSLGAGETIRFEPMALVVLGAVISTSIYFVYQKPILEKVPSLSFTAVSIIAGTVVLIPFGLDLPAKLLTAGTGQLVSMAWLGLAPSFIGYLLWNMALSRAPASKVSLFLNAQPAIAGLIAWVWLGQVPTILTWIGGVLLIVGVLLGTVRGKPAVSRKPAA